MDTVETKAARKKAPDAVQAIRHKANVLANMINKLSDLPSADASEIVATLYKTFYISED